ncbi:MAG: hypothetical protein HY897_09460 [Deltaproteobacteria bacterium]|nr:hypothetical protein [Deltaproteobacteria bacterium]
MPKPLFHILESDFDNRIAFVTDLVSVDAPWTGRVEELHDTGGNITGQTVPAVEAVNPRLAVESFCHKHGLILTDKLFLNVK